MRPAPQRRAPPQLSPPQRRRRRVRKLRRMRQAARRRHRRKRRSARRRRLRLRLPRWRRVQRQCPRRRSAEARRRSRGRRRTRHKSPSCRCGPCSVVLHASPHTSHVCAGAAGARARASKRQHCRGSRLPPATAAAGDRGAGGASGGSSAAAGSRVSAVGAGGGGAGTGRAEADDPRAGAVRRRGDGEASSQQPRAPKRRGKHARWPCFACADSGLTVVFGTGPACDGIGDGAHHADARRAASRHTGDTGAEMTCKNVLTQHQHTRVASAAWASAKLELHSAVSELLSTKHAASAFP